MKPLSGLTALQREEHQAESHDHHATYPAGRNDSVLRVIAMGSRKKLANGNVHLNEKK